MKEFNLPSQHGNLRGVVWDDVQKPIGTVQIAHGLAEFPIGPNQLRFPRLDGPLALVH